MKKGRWIAKMVVLGIIFIVLVGFVTQLLWNWLVPALFAGPVITYWQALGLLLLAKILFGFGKGSGHRYGGGHWKPYWKQKWDAMSPEDRERFKQKMREKCGWGTRPQSSEINDPQSKPKDS
ncbi:MAG: hypothetical protein AB7K37_08375 [Cyclobacteriaceae bacterium]